MFTVRWRRSARDELAALWTQADAVIRQAITAATNEIDRRLARDPTNLGESRGDELRIWFVFPLGVRFRIDLNHAVVHVIQVWNFRRRS